MWWRGVREWSGDPGVRGALVEAGGGLNLELGLVTELFQAAAAAVGHGAAEAGHELERELGDGVLVRVHRNLDAAGPLDEDHRAPLLQRAQTTGRAITNGREGRGPAALLDEAPLAIGGEIRRGLDRADEHGTEHDPGGARAEQDVEVPFVANPTVGPDVRTERASAHDAVEDGGELGPSVAGDHSRGAGAARADPHLDDVGARGDEVFHTLGGADVARDEGEALGQDVANRPNRLEALALVPVGRVDHDHVHPRLEQLGRALDRVARDSDRGPDEQTPLRVQGRAQEGAQEDVLLADHPDQGTVLADDRGGVLALPHEDVHGIFEVDAVRDHREVLGHGVRDEGRVRLVGEVLRREDAHRLAVLHHHRQAGGVDADVLARGVDRVVRADRERLAAPGVRGLDLADDLELLVERPVLRQDRQSAAQGEGARHAPPRAGQHVGRHHRERAAAEVDRQHVRRQGLAGVPLEALRVQRHLRGRERGMSRLRVREPRECFVEHASLLLLPLRYSKDPEGQ